MRIPESVLRWTSVVEKNRHPGVRTELILAMIWQETDPIGDRYSYRYEPGYKYFFHFKSKRSLYAKWKNEADNRDFALKELGPTEFHAQSASWGLLQIMGAVAREYGFGGSMPELCDPELNIRLATKYLWLYGFQDGKNSTEKALARYNGSETYSIAVIDKLSLIA